MTMHYYSIPFNLKKNLTHIYLISADLGPDHLGKILFDTLPL